MTIRVMNLAAVRGSFRLEPSALVVGVLRGLELMAANIASVKIEGRQRSPAYVSQVAKVWRQAIDRCKADPQNFIPQSAWITIVTALPVLPSAA